MVIYFLPHSGINIVSKGWPVGGFIVFLYEFYFPVFSIPLNTYRHRRRLLMGELKIYGNKRPCSNLRYHPTIFLEGLRKFTRNCSQFDGLHSEI